MLKVIVSASVLLLAAAAPHTDRPFPRYDVNKICNDEAERIKASTFWLAQCLSNEQEGYDEARYYWPLLNSNDRDWCASRADQAEPYKYTVLAACLGPRYDLQRATTPVPFEP